MNVNNQQESWTSEERMPESEYNTGISAPPSSPVPAPSPVPITAPIVASNTTVNTVETSPPRNFKKIFGILGSGVGIVIGILILIGSGILMVRKSKGIKTEATIVSADCKSNSTEGNTDLSKSLYTCELNLKYMDIAGKEVITKTTIDSNTYYTSNQTITIYYSSDKPSEITIQESNNKVLSWILLAIGLIILIASAIGMYFVLQPITTVQVV